MQTKNFCHPSCQMQQEKKDGVNENGLDFSNKIYDNCETHLHEKLMNGCLRKKRSPWWMDSRARESGWVGDIYGLSGYLSGIGSVVWSDISET